MSRSNMSCRCAYCFETPKSNLFSAIGCDVFPWPNAYSDITGTQEKLVALQKDVLRLLQWQVISSVYKNVHPTAQKRDYDVSISSVVNLAPNIINNLFPKLTEDVLPTNFVHQAFSSISNGIFPTKTVSQLLANMIAHPLVEFLAFGPCCLENKNINLDEYLPAATNNIQAFIKLLHFIIDNTCHKRISAIHTTNEFEECFQEDSDERLGILTIYKQDKKDCITGYCSFSRASIFNRLKNHNERIKPYTNPTTFTITYENESIVLLTTLEIIIEVLHTNTLHTPIEFVISSDDHENNSFTNGLVYRGVNKKAFTVSMKKRAPTWCKNYVKYATGTLSLLGILGNTKFGSHN